MGKMGNMLAWLFALLLIVIITGTGIATSNLSNSDEGYFYFF